MLRVKGGTWGTPFVCTMILRRRAVERLSASADRSSRANGQVRPGHDLLHASPDRGAVPGGRRKNRPISRTIPASGGLRQQGGPPPMPGNPDGGGLFRGLFRTYRLVPEPLHEAGDIDDRPPVRPLANQTDFLAARDLERHGPAVNLDEFDLGADFHARRCRCHMADVDVGMPTVCCPGARNGRSPMMQVCSMKAIIMAFSSTGGMSRKPGQQGSISGTV